MIILALDLTFIGVIVSCDSAVSEDDEGGRDKALESCGFVPWIVPWNNEILKKFMNLNNDSQFQPSDQVSIILHKMLRGMQLILAMINE